VHAGLLQTVSSRNWRKVNAERLLSEPLHFFRDAPYFLKNKESEEGEQKEGQEKGINYQNARESFYLKNDIR
jgi:hypothetical protein